MPLVVACHSSTHVKNGYQGQAITKQKLKTSWVDASIQGSSEGINNNFILQIHKLNHFLLYTGYCITVFLKSNSLYYFIINTIETHLKIYIEGRKHYEKKSYFVF